MTPSTKSLVSLALSGDRAAFETLVSQHQGSVFAFIASRARNLDVAEEITQRAFVESFICLKTLRKPEKFGSWTKGIALNVWKKSLSNRQVPTDDAVLSRLIDQTDQPNPGMTSGPDSPDLAFEKQEFRDVIFREVGLLDENLSEVVLLHYMEELSYREIAALLDVPESTIAWPAAVGQAEAEGPADALPRRNAAGTETGCPSKDHGASSAGPLRTDRLVSAAAINIRPKDAGSGRPCRRGICRLLHRTGHRSTARG